MSTSHSEKESDRHHAGQGLHRRQLKAARRAALGAYVPESAEAIAARRRAYGGQDQEDGVERSEGR